MRGRIVDMIRKQTEKQLIVQNKWQNYYAVNAGMRTSILILGLSGQSVLGLLSMPGHPTHLDNSRPTVLAVGAGGDCLDIFLSPIIPISFLPLCGRCPDID